MIIEHRPGRPLWTCVLDGEDWPCGPARASLLDAYRQNPPLLTAHLTALLRQAVDGLRFFDPTRLYPRFVAWSLEEHQVCRVCGRGGHDVVPGAPPRLVPCDVLNRLAGPGS